MKASHEPNFSTSYQQTCFALPQTAKNNKSTGNTKMVAEGCRWWIMDR